MNKNIFKILFDFLSTFAKIGIQIRRVSCSNQTRVLPLFFYSSEAERATKSMLPLTMPPIKTLNCFFSLFIIERIGQGIRKWQSGVWDLRNLYLASHSFKIRKTSSNAKNLGLYNLKLCCLCLTEKSRILFFLKIDEVFSQFSLSIRLAIK